MQGLLAGGPGVFLSILLFGFLAVGTEFGPTKLGSLVSNDKLHLFRVSL
jgi:hypothetical protein